MNISENLLLWYDENKRDLPWRSVENPYVIWVAEVVFQQTRIAQGLPYFNAFITKFPSVNSLADASEVEILKSWQGLGYYSRARNLHFSAKFIMDELKGEFPNNYKDLLKLKGVGPYIAAEVASVSFNEVVAAVDGNVQRVLARYFGIEDAVNSTIGTKEINALANAHISNNRPGDFNQALMDYGSGVCSPKKPKCDICVFQDTCWALRNDRVGDLPLKLKRVKVKSRYLNFFISIVENKIAIQRRGDGDVWQGLYQMPMIETTEVCSEIEKCNTSYKGYLLSESKRILTHQKLFLRFWILKDSQRLDKTKYDWVTFSELLTFPVPKSMEQLFLTKAFRSLFSGVDY